MSLDPALLDHLGRLARLELSADDRARLALDLERVLDLLGALAAVPIDGVAPLAHPLDATLLLREDRVTEPDLQGELLALAPETHGGYYLVPRVVE